MGTPVAVSVAEPCVPGEGVPVDAVVAFVACVEAVVAPGRVVEGIIDEGITEGGITDEGIAWEDGIVFVWA